MNTYLILLTAVVAVYITAQILRARRLIALGSQLSRATQPFVRSHGNVSLLILGDSTAVGVGAERPVESVPGRLSELLDASVESYARSGAVVSEISDQFSRAQRDRYDLILIQVGGNDIIKMRDLQTADRELSTTLAMITGKSDRVVLLTAGRIGKAPFFPRFVAPLFSHRSLVLRRLFIETAHAHNVLYVDLLGMADAFSADPDRYYARDMLHLTGAGYGLWFERIIADIRARWPELFSAPKSG